jgi:hypothetical protein
MQTQRQSDTENERRTDTHGEQRAVNQPRPRVVDDPDPHAHLTPAERYARALQRRDALVTAERPSSPKRVSSHVHTRDESD